MPQHTVNEQLKNRTGAVNRRVDKLGGGRARAAQVKKQIPAQRSTRTPSRLPSIGLPVISAPTPGIGNNVKEAFRRAGDELRQNRGGGQLNRALPPPSPFQLEQPVTPQLAQPIQTVAPQPAPQAAPQATPQPQVQETPFGQPVPGPIALGAPPAPQPQVQAAPIAQPVQGPVALGVPPPVPFAPPAPVAPQRARLPRGPLNATQRFAPQGQFPQGQRPQLGGGLNRNQMLNFMNVLQQLMQRFQGQRGAF